MSLLNYLRQFFENPAYHSGYDGIWTRLVQRSEERRVGKECSS